PKRAAGTILRSPLAYFAEGYKLLRDKDFAGANRVFEEMTTHYTIENTYAGAYFARAAAKSGNGETLERYLDGSLIQHPNMRFEVNLGKAFFAGARGEHAEALKHLKVVRNNRPHTESRPIFTEYQLAEACEWLFQDTGNTAYRDFALDWVRKYQRLAPMYSWA